MLVCLRKEGKALLLGKCVKTVFKDMVLFWPQYQNSQYQPHKIMRRPGKVQKMNKFPFRVQGSFWFQFEKSVRLGMWGLNRLNDNRSVSGELFNLADWLKKLPPCNWVQKSHALLVLALFSSKLGLMLPLEWHIRTLLSFFGSFSVCNNC